MEVGDLVYIKNSPDLGIALITKCEKVMGKVDCLIRWADNHPERATYMYIYSKHLELVSEGK